MTTIRVRSHGKYRQEIVADEHTFYADEPTSIGGQDTAANPYAILLGSLGACTSITLEMYAHRKGWPLDGIEIELSHRKDYAQDCEVCAEQDARIDKVDLTIKLFGPLDATQQARLHEIAQRCPVNQTLSKGMHITHHAEHV
jgi:putative redox protein